MPNPLRAPLFALLCAVSRLSLVLMSAGIFPSESRTYVSAALPVMPKLIASPRRSDFAPVSATRSFASEAPVV